MLVNPDQVESYNLPTDEYGKAVQAEAFPIPDARALLELAIKEFASEAQIADHRRRESDLHSELVEVAEEIDQSRDDSLCHWGNKS